MNATFAKAIEQYTNIVRAKLQSDVPTGCDKNGKFYTTRGSMLGATYARLVFTDNEQRYFYDIYDKLWSEGHYVEAYSLMRLVFGALNKAMIEHLYRAGHLFTYNDIYTFAKTG